MALLAQSLARGAYEALSQLGPTTTCCEQIYENEGAITLTKHLYISPPLAMARGVQKQYVFCKLARSYTSVATLAIQSHTFIVSRQKTGCDAARQNIFIREYPVLYTRRACGSRKVFFRRLSPGHKRHYFVSLSWAGPVHGQP